MIRKIGFLCLWITCLIPARGNGQSLILTGVYDGPLPGGLPKGVEIYVPNAIADLSKCGIGSANNGGGSDGQEYTFPPDQVAAGSFIYVSSEATEFETWFGFPTSYSVGPTMSINGDDAVEVFCNDSVVDTFGDINASGTGQGWEYLDGWAYRNAGTGPSGTTFMPSEWTFSGPDVWDGEEGNTNATSAHPIPVGTYSGSLAAELTGLKVKVDARHVVLAWRTLSETNNAGFDVQLRSENSDWQTAGFVTGHGTSSSPVDYQFRIDLDPGRYYGRLRQSDLDGTSSYSQSIPVEVGLDDAFELSDVYPNPVSTRLHLGVMVNRAQTLEVGVFDALGRRVLPPFRRHANRMESTRFEFDASALQQGTYFVRVVGENFSETRRVAIAH